MSDICLAIPSYDVPHRIFSSTTYPLQAPNGSTIIIYGHEQGIRLLWRGGRRFRSASVRKESRKVNGSSKEDAMVLDSDDDEPAVEGVSSREDFETDEEENDSSESYHKVIRHIDVHFGTCARHIAVPPIPADIRDAGPGAFPPILLSSIVVAAACNDGSIRLVALPLLPPLPSVDQTSYTALEQVTIAGANTHQEVPSSIALTHSAVPGIVEALQEPSKSRSRSRNRSSEDKDTTKSVNQSDKTWCFMLVSISTTAGGLLLTHQIPLTSETQLSLLAEDLHPIQRCYLGFPCLSSRLVFNPSAFPADRHSTILVSAADAACVKLYQASPDSRSDRFRARRNSTATDDSATSGQRLSSRNSRPNGRFLITLYPGFICPSGSPYLQRRKRILDVAWVSSGRAVIALLEDGEWGIWDLEGVGPGSGAGTLVRGQSSMSGIQGGALTKFAFGGWVTSMPKGMQKSQTADVGGTKGSKLAPMTPHTRKVRSEGLFKGGEPPFRPEKVNSRATKGYIGVVGHASSTMPTISTSDESLVLAHGSTINYVTSLQALWRARSSSKGTFDSVESIRQWPIEDLVLDQERLIGVAELGPCPSVSSEPPFGTKNRKAPDLLIVAEHRLILYASPLTRSTSAEAFQTRIPLRFGKAQTPALEGLPDQALLGQGQLDLEGMDRILEGMTHGNGGVNAHTVSFGKSVAFDLDGGEDMSMTSPTPKVAGKSKRTPARSIGRSKGSAFS